ncbi:MAG: CNNM domain-containing protein, partial [Desulfobulbaceae bacterium]
MLTVLICTVTLAIIFSALCSLMEAALYSLRLSHIEVLAKKKPETARLLKRLKTNINEPITDILTLNTIANTIGAAISGAAAAAVFGEHFLIWFSIAFTFTIL